MKKLTPCCANRCLVFGCDIKEAGGCNCQCRRKDYILSLKSVVAGHELALKALFIYYPNKEDAAKKLASLPYDEKLHHQEFLENAIKELEEEE